MQVIEYASLPNTKEIAYLPTIMKALGEIKRSTPTFKEFRDWLKEQMLWDKEAWPVVWPLLDVKVGERLHLGDFAAKLLATDDEDEARKLLYQRLLKRNEILCKYVFEALDERLHSTHELYRLITSYVYPGEYITLVNFQHWIKWMAAIGYIKFVGIRWGLSEIARAEIERIKQIDVEEILEDERLEREVAKSRKPEDEAGAAAAEGAPAEGAVPVAASAGGFDPPDDDDFDGPEAHFVEDVDPDALRATSNAAPAAQQTGAPARGASSKSATASRASAASASTTPVTVTPLPRVEHRRYVIPQISSDDLLASVNRIKAWWANYADKKLYQVSDFGLASADYAADRLKFLFKVVCIGRLVVHDDLSPVYYPFVEELQKRRVFDRLFAEESLEMLLGEVDYFSGNPWFARAAENFVPFLALR
ncbi:MAG: hypothetical protein KC609_12750, partial [Myxococcales bacterium]|nr:hypothetical protein [Myxococcales bacterium]